MPELIDDAARVNAAAWERHALIRLAEPAAAPREPPARFRWAQSANLGPGAELFGDLAGARVAELGCGAGDNLAHLATRGVGQAVGVDLAAGQITRARARWGHLPRTVFVVADARAFLNGLRDEVDVCYSVFGALEFCPPEQLLPLIAARLRPGGHLLFSVRHPTSTPAPELTLGDGTAAPLIRFERSVTDWIALVIASGLAVTVRREIRTADQTPCCLIIRASKP